MIDLHKSSSYIRALQMDPFMRINGSVCAYLRTYRSIHGCFFHTTPFSCRHDSRNRTAHDSEHIAVSGIQSGIHFLPANSVPAALPATKAPPDTPRW